jgi:organic radical activating enzyme
MQTKDRIVYLMPFTVKSVLLYHALLKRNIPIAGFFDNDSTIHGKYYNDCPISVPMTPPSLCKDTIIILCEQRHYEANEGQLALFGYDYLDRIDDWLTYDDAKRFISQIDFEVFRSIVPRQANALKMLPWTIQHAVLPSYVVADDALVIDVLQLIVTEKCSLRCKNCANLMQYFTNPQHMNLEQIYRDIDILFSKVDWIRDFFVFGGEAFLHKQLPEILEYAAKYRRQFGLLIAITNGTVVPNDSTLQVMKEQEMFVSISDYGSRSHKIDKLIERLEQYQIPFHRMNVKWFEYQQLVNGDTGDAQSVFSACKENCVSLRNGLLYRCPFLVHAEALNAIPHSEHNHIDISHSEVSKVDIAEHLAHPLNRALPPPPGCAYCSGYDKGNMKEIPVAEQTDTPLPYITYSAT